MEDKLYAQYGCGLTAPLQWLNFDSSPTLRIQRTLILGRLLKQRLNCNFPDNVKYGDIVKGLPLTENSCDGIYCSHVLEHLSLQDFRAALQNTYRILRPGGIFRCIVPDLEISARNYIHDLESGSSSANTTFLKSILLGVERRPRGLKKILSESLGNSHHLWMWDYKSLCAELKSVGFTDIRRCAFNDSLDKMFSFVESEQRFLHAVAIECRK